MELDGAEISEGEIKYIKVDPYSYAKGSRFGLMLAKELVNEPENKGKLTEAIIKISKDIKEMEKAKENE